MMQYKHNLIYIVLALLWAGLIYFLSDQESLRTSLPNIYDLVLRKLAHIFMFAVLAIVLAKIFDQHDRLTIFFVVLLAILYALSDEIHQLNVIGRQGSARDILIDSFGVLCGIIYLRRQHYFQYFNQKKSTQSLAKR